VLWFEVLLYRRLRSTALSVAFHDRDAEREMTEQMILGRNRARRLHDPSSGLLRLARGPAAQELAALGAGRSLVLSVISLVQIISDAAWGSIAH